MRKLNVLILLALCVVFLPALASAGNGTGACMIQAPDTVVAAFPEGKGEGAVCIDDLTEQECLDPSEGQAEWFEGLTCGELDVPWDWEGSCQADVVPYGDQCYVLWFDGEAELACTQQGGSWFDDLGCGMPVPAMPSFVMVMMVLVLLGGALVLLTIRGSLPSA